MGERIVGTGNIAKYSTAATLYLMSSIENVYLYNPRRVIDNTELSIFKEEIKRLLNEADKKLNAEFNIVNDINKITSISDIIITATPSEEALINKDWVRPGTHFSCMGACMAGKQEIDENIFTKARIFADDEKQCLKQGETQCAYNKGIVSNFDGEIGDVILNKKVGRLSNDDITIFDSTGLFLQDLSTSIELIKEANKKNIDIEIEL